MARYMMIVRDTETGNVVRESDFDGMWFCIYNRPGTFGSGMVANINFPEHVSLLGVAQKDAHEAMENAINNWEDV